MTVIKSSWMLLLIFNVHKCRYTISIINHTLQSTIRAVISTLTCTSMVSNSTSDSECYLAVRVHVKVLITALIVRGLKCVIN